MDTSNSVTTPGAQDAIDRLNAPGAIRQQNQLATLDQSDFLRLLTTQLTLQDPLEPTSNEEMLAQMAQFSALEAQTASSDTLNDISTKLDALIEAQEAATNAATAAAEAATQAAQAAQTAITQVT
ncbi:MAG: flagellar hook capping FlgD N-terminal domain-containing protein [Erythrobacter sp.]|nr:flagellar hook capping FlgD N-terminal domain-containing protein [Erythrobacter sp.]